MKLVIGNKNYSSWSLRPWLLLHAHGVDFDEVNASLTQKGIKERLGAYSDSCKVPVLIDGELTVWDSLAICEYVSEVYLDGQGWPSDHAARAQARSVCAEMHSGFNAVRSEMPMNCRLEKVIMVSQQAKQEIQRIESIWQQYAVENEQGRLSLFGGFGIADCFFAPIALRFKTYGIELSGKAKSYQDTLLNHPSTQAWVSAALEETEVVEENEV